MSLHAKNRALFILGALLVFSGVAESQTSWFGGSQNTSGIWTETYTAGWTTTPTATGHWTKSGRMCTLTVLGVIPTSNATNFVIGGVPAVCQPGTVKNVAIPTSIMENNSVAGLTTPVDLSVGSTLQFFLNGNAAGGWTNVGGKGINGSLTITYSLD